MASIQYDQEYGHWALKCTEEAIPALMGLFVEWEDEDSLDFESIAVASGFRIPESEGELAEVYFTNEFVEWWAEADADDREFVMKYKPTKIIPNDQLEYLLTGNPYCLEGDE